MSEPKDNEVVYATAPNGLRMVVRRAPGLTECCGVVISAGSRDESDSRQGLAHFIEHTIFKGTSRHRASYVINRMEAVGGELNAYTTKEETIVYSLMPAGNYGRAIDLIAELVSDSRFPEAELNRERDVIADEIDSYLDTPSEAVFDDFEDLLFRGNPLGHNILGTKASIATFTPDVCRQWLSTYYTAPNMVFFYLGPASAERVTRRAERAFSTLPATAAPIIRQIPQPVDFVEERHTDNHQAHTVAGTVMPGGMHSPGRYALALLTNMLGGPGMNSWLNVALREKRGLVYTVEASTALLTDIGLTTIYFGCDSADVGRCLRLAGGCLDRMASDRVTGRVLDAAKRQYLGQLAVSSDSREQTAISCGRATMYYGRVASTHQIRESILAVTPDDIRATAASLSADRLSRLTLA